MKRASTLLTIAVALIALAFGYGWGRIDGRNAALITEFKIYSANMRYLTQWETSQPPELKDFVKAHYYHLANRIPEDWVGTPKNFGPVSTNISTLTVFKESNAHLEYADFLKRFPQAKAQAQRIQTNVSAQEPESSSSSSNSSNQTVAKLSDAQRKLLEELSLKVKTGNSIADIHRLKDSLNRWDELFIDPAPEELKPVYAILKDKVSERLAELELEAKSTLPAQE